MYPLDSESTEHGPNSLGIMGRSFEDHRSTHGTAERKRQWNTIYFAVVKSNHFMLLHHNESFIYASANDRMLSSGYHIY